MRINYTDQSINNIQNNPLKNLHLTNAKYAKDEDNNNVSATLSLSQESVDKYFEEGIFDASSMTGSDKLSKLSINDNNSTDVVRRYGEKYAEVYKKIVNNVPEDKRNEYIEKLNTAFEEATEKESKKMYGKMKKLLNSNEIKSPLNQESFNKLFTEVAYAVKDYFVESNDEDINTYVNNKINFTNRTDFKTYEAFGTVMDIVDITDNLTNKMNKLKDLLTSNSPDDITQSKDLFNTIKSYSQIITNDIEKLNKLKESLNEDDLGDSVKKGLLKAIDKKVTGLNDMNGKLQRYTEYLEKYDKIQKKIKKALAKRDALNAKLDKANQAKNQDLIGMYLKRVAAADSQIAELRAQSAEIEAEMANLLKDIKEMDI